LLAPRRPFFVEHSLCVADNMGLLLRGSLQVEDKQHLGQSVKGIFGFLLYYVCHQITPDYQLTPSQWGAGGGSATHKEPTQAPSAESNQNQTSKHGCHQPTHIPNVSMGSAMMPTGEVDSNPDPFIPGCSGLWHL
jgi:hypothetical protein